MFDYKQKLDYTLVVQMHAPCMSRFGRLITPKIFFSRAPHKKHEKHERTQVDRDKQSLPRNVMPAM